LDRIEPQSGRSLRDIIMEIPSQVFPGTPLFHNMDKQWRSENGVTFTFLPENDSDARTIVAGLIPYLRCTAEPWYLSMFTSEAKLRHASSKWDHTTRQVFSVEEFEIDEFLAEDDEYNKTDEPTAERPSRREGPDESYIQVHVPIIIDPEDSPKMYEETDSVSTFHQKEGPTPASISPSKSFTPNIVSNPPSILASSTSDSKPNDIDYQEDGESVSKLSDLPDELFEALTLIQTEKIGRFPIVLVGVEYWEGLVKWVKQVMLDEQKNISTDDMELFIVVDTADAAVKHINDFYSKYLLSPNF